MASCHVDTTSRLIQWSIDNFGSYCSLQSPVNLNIGNSWEWSFILQKCTRSERVLVVPNFLCRAPTCSLIMKHFPKLPGDVGNNNNNNALIASFTIRILSLSRGRNTLFYKETRDMHMKSGMDFVWGLDVPLTGRVIVQVEFIHLNSASPNVGESCFGFPQKDLNATASSYLGKMLSESIHTDIMICASDGSNIGAHRAILAARSPVFSSMFSHDLKEKKKSAINIPDMSIEALQVFLSYMYSNIGYKDFVSHRLELVRAADKYDVSDLKDACEESLLQDIDTKNVLERLQNAFLYRLPKLKVCCIGYLVKFGKIFEIREELNEFIESGDRKLVGEVIKEVISALEGL